MNRGGSWNNEAANCRSANRNTNEPSNRNNNNGFRVALNSNGEWRMPWDSGWNSSFSCLTGSKLDSNSKTSTRGRVVLVAGWMTESNAPRGLY